MAAPILVATVGSSTANSYATVAEATTYLNERLNATAWTTAITAATGDPERALIQATRLIDRESFEGDSVYPLNGASSDTTQALKWPRYATTNDDGWEWLQSVIPQCVKDATCELALYLLNQGTGDPTQPTGLEGFANVKVGALDITPRFGYAPDGLPNHVREMLAPVLARGRNTVRLMRG